MKGGIRCVFTFFPYCNVNPDFFLQRRPCTNPSYWICRRPSASLTSSGWRRRAENQRSRAGRASRRACRRSEETLFQGGPRHSVSTFARRERRCSLDDIEEHPFEHRVPDVLHFLVRLDPRLEGGPLVAGPLHQRRRRILRAHNHWVGHVGAAQRAAEEGGHCAVKRKFLRGLCCKRKFNVVCVKKKIQCCLSFKENFRSSV